MKVVLKNVRLAFPDLFTPVQFDGQGEARYGANFLFAPDSENAKLVEDTIKTVAAETWGAKAATTLKGLAGNSNKYCYGDGDTKTCDGYEGQRYISAHRNSAQGAPSVVDSNKSPLTAASGRPYAGCYVNASIDIWAQKGQYTGIRASLVGVQFLRDGDAFAGAPATDADFEDLGDSDEEINL